MIESGSAIAPTVNARLSTSAVCSKRAFAFHAKAMAASRPKKLFRERRDERLLPERPGAPEPVGQHVGPDGTEEEGADENDRQHNDLERFHRMFQDGGRF